MRNPLLRTAACRDAQTKARHEMSNEKRDAITPGAIESYPVLPLRDIVVFPAHDRAALRRRARSRFARSRR